MKDSSAPKLFAAVGRGRTETPVMIIKPGADSADIIGSSGPKQAGSIGAAPGGEHLYVGTKVSADEGQPNGGVQAIRFNPENTSLELLNVEPTGGSTVASIGVNPKFPLVACANFRLFGRFGGEGAGSRGSVSIHQRFDDGSISPLIQRLEFSGSSVHPERQTNSHPHMTGFDPSGGWLCTTDLGIDRVVLNKVAADGQEVSVQEKRIAAPAGSGPRHFVFHPNGRWLFVLTEMSCEVLVFAFDPETGACELKQNVSAKNAEGRGGGAADIRFHPEQQQVLASVRNGSFVAQFGWDEEKATLTQLGVEEVGSNPRAIFITDHYLFAPALDDAGLGCWRFDEAGKLQYLYHRPEIPVPGAYTALS